jgi:hypothetical protein
MYSSKRAALETLASVPSARARRFLLELANLRNEPEAGKRFRLNFVGLWPLPGETRHGRLIAENISRAPGAKPEDEQIDEMLDEMWILPLREEVRVLWTTPDLRTRQWGMFRLINQWVIQENGYLGYLFPFVEKSGSVAFLPPPTAFEQALLYLYSHRTGFCPNPDCPAPYFFLTRPRQKYCSESCALPAQREFKRRWWADNGPEWRNKRTRRGRHKK